MIRAYFSVRPETTPVGEIDGRKVREFTEPFTFFYEGHLITIPKGFQTDCASVPRLPLLWLCFGDEGEIAAYCHDYLYRIDSDPECSKFFADDVFYEMMKFTNDPDSAWKRELMLFAVSKFGASSYHKKKVFDRLC
jgi:hypothetical protein